MGTKFYKPLITEFKVGFRYERADIYYNETNFAQRQWIKETYSSATDSLTIQTIEGLLNNNSIRVKCLDDDDFIDAGWLDNELQSSDFIADFILNKDFTTTIFQDTIRINWRYEVLLNAHIRNYNELLDVMQMLNIK